MYFKSCRYYAKPTALQSIYTTSIPGSVRQVRGSDGVLRSEVLISDRAAFENMWHQAVEALEKAIGLLRHPQEFGAISSQYLPYASILPAFASLQAEAGQLPAESRLTHNER